LSRHVPVTTVEATSGPEYVFVGSHESTVDVASAPAKAMAIGARYQPLTLGWRPGMAVATGAVASYFTGSDAVAVLPALSRQVPSTALETVSGPE
jgi:hypothetical protein